MWLLTNINTNSILILINEKSTYTVGRLGADFIIEGDTSVSRIHAFLHITGDSNDASAGKEVLALEDAGSKFGTFHENGLSTNVAVMKKVRVPLNNGDRIRFGLFRSVWKVTDCTPYSAISALPAAYIQQLAQVLKVFGGKIHPNWDTSCTHLTMTGVSLTPKVLHALLDQKPIVTCAYWRDLVQAARRGRNTLPVIEAYAPKFSDYITQNQQIDLSCRPERKTVFNGLTFVFLSALHNKTYGTIVEKAGGCSTHLNVGLERSMLVRNDVVVIQYIPLTESQSSQTINSIEEHLRSHSRRIVPEYEIGLAIIHCSTEKYCNASYQIISDPLPAPMSCNISSDDSQVLETEIHLKDCTITDNEQPELFIPKTDEKSVVSTKISSSAHVDLSDDPAISVEINHRKRTRTANDDKNGADTDEELFSFPKKANIEGCPSLETSTSEESNVPKSAAKPLPNAAIDRRQNTVIHTTSFLEKQPAPTVDISANKDNNIQGKEPAKRTHCDVIGNTDEEDLFTFDASQNTNNSKRPRMENSLDDDLFAFDEKKKADESQTIDLSDKTTEPFILKTKTKNVPPMPKPKLLPATTNTANWFSFPTDKIQMKAEIKEEGLETKKETDGYLSETDGNDILKGGAIVVVKLSKKSLSREENKYSQSQSANCNSSAAKANGKRFVKKYKPKQHQIIRTVPVIVGGLC